MIPIYNKDKLNIFVKGEHESIHENHYVVFHIAFPKNLRHINLIKLEKLENCNV